MNQNSETDSIQQAVLDKVRAGSVHRIPRAHFILRVAATVAVGALLLVLLAFVISFIIFSVHESGEQFLLGFGWSGIAVFFTLFPWVLVGFTIALTLLLELLLRGFKFGYRVPLLPIFGGIIGVSILCGLLISFTPLHSMLLGFAKHDQLPILGSTYEHVLDHHEDEGVCRGEVVSVSTSTDMFVVQHNDGDHDHDDGTFIIHIDPKSGMSAPRVGDEVLVFGEPEAGYILAEHIQPLSPQEY